MKRQPAPPPPPGLTASRLEVGGAEFIVFEWPEASTLPAAPKKKKAAKDRALLSPRETVVAGFVARGYQNLQIAANLGVSVHTIRHQVASIHRKTGTFNRTDFAAWWHAQRRD